jgi:2'-5' RNA ligase
MAERNERNSSKMLRLFVALLLPDEAKAELGRLVDRLKPLATGVKWVEPVNLHLTLKFLGDTTEEKLAAISVAIGEAVKENPKVTVDLAKCGAFPNLKRPRVIWAGCDGIEPAAVMAKEIDRRMRKFGFEKEKRRFSAHLTLGRVRDRADITRLVPELEHLNFRGGTYILDRVALIKSTLTPKGPIYEHCQMYELV